MNEKLEERTRILVVEDSAEDRERLISILGDNCDCPIIRYDSHTAKSISNEESLRNIEECLRNQPYKAILMDGKLGLELDHYSCDGEVLTCNLQKGMYGSLNQRTPVYNTSANFEIPGVCGHISKRMSERIKEDLQREGLIK